jgi:hypothetical protein
MLPAGFRTDNHGSLYAIDRQERTVRHNLSGHSEHGQVHAANRCVYLTQQQALQVKEWMNARHDEGKVRLVYLDKKTRVLHTWTGDDSTLPADGHPGVGFFDRRTGALIDSWPTRPEPAVGMLPFEMEYMRDAKGDTISGRHLGHPIHRVYETPQEFDSALKQSGFKPFFTPAAAPLPRPSGKAPAPRGP